MPEPVVLLSEKARISNAELITKTDLGPAEGSMGGNGFPLAHVPEWNRNFSKETKIFNHLSIVLRAKNQALR